jgi:hypothetical protein
MQRDIDVINLKINNADKLPESLIKQDILKHWQLEMRMLIRYIEADKRALKGIKI